MINKKIRKLVLAALFAALCCLMTMIVQIPAPMGYGYVNLGDCAVLLGAWVVGGWWGAAAAAVGSALADLLAAGGTYAIYAPGTFVIKFLMAAVAAYSMRVVKKHWGVPLGAVAAELLMVAGYFLYESVIYEEGAVASVPLNLIQGAVNMIVAVAVVVLLDRAGVLKRLKQ